MKRFAGFGLLFALVWVFAGMAEGEALAKEKEDSTIHTGVYADEIDLSGMTTAEAKAEVDAYITRLKEDILTLELFDEQMEVTL